MHSLTRQRTLESVLSWWSDSNLPGPTMSLQAASKPLLKFLYHRQVLDFIKRNHDAPLSEETLQTCLDYLAFKYLSPATKITILKELDARVCQNDHDAFAVAHSPVLHQLVALLGSPEAQIRRCTSWIVGNLAVDEFTAMSLLTANPWVKLVALLQDRDVEVIEGAIYALSQIAQWPDVVQLKGATEASTLNSVVELLESPNGEVRASACLTVGRLANHQSTAPATLRLKPCLRLVSLLQDAEVDVVECVVFALSQIAQWPDGAQNAVAANALDYVLELLKSPNPLVRGWTCTMMGWLAFWESTSVAVLSLSPSVPLVSLFHYKDAKVTEDALYALSQIAYWPDGAHTVVEAKTLNHLAELLESPNITVRYWTSKMLGNLASHESTAVAILRMGLCSRLVSLLRDTDFAVRASAILAIANISEFKAGIAAVGHTALLNRVSHLMEVGDRDVQLRTCTILRNFIRYNRALGIRSN